jgi:predicted TIM-barrel fold metal-dependent hydrolase
MPDDPKVLDGWLEITGAREMLLFASNYPSWDAFDPRDAFTSVAPGMRERILSENARALYKIKPGATVPGGQAGAPGQ